MYGMVNALPVADGRTHLSVGAQIGLEPEGVDGRYERLHGVEGCSRLGGVLFRTGQKRLHTISW